MKTHIIFLCAVVACCPFAQGASHDEDFTTETTPSYEAEKSEVLSHQIPLVHFTHGYTVEEETNSQKIKEESTHIGEEQKDQEKTSQQKEYSQNFVDQLNAHPEHSNIPDSLHFDVEVESEKENPKTDSEVPTLLKNSYIASEEIFHHADQDTQNFHDSQSHGSQEETEQHSDETTEGVRSTPEHLNDFQQDDDILTDAIHLRISEPNGEENITYAQVEYVNHEGAALKQGNETSDTTTASPGGSSTSSSSASDSTSESSSSSTASGATSETSSSTAASDASSDSSTASSASDASSSSTVAGGNTESSTGSSASDASTSSTVAGASTESSTGSSASDASTSSTVAGESTDSSSSTSSDVTTLAPSNTTDSTVSNSTDTSNSTSSSDVTTPSSSTTSSNGTSTDDVSTSNSTVPETTTPSGDVSETTAETTTTKKPPKKKPPYNAVLNCRCGTQTTKRLEVGSVKVDTNVHPWTVMINNTQGRLCSGNIINSKFIVTSASCLRGQSIRELTIKAALTMRNKTVRFTPERISIHPAYNPNTQENNIALLEVKETIHPSKTVKFICLPISDDNTNSTGTLVTLARDSSSKEVVLYTEQVKQISNRRCATLAKRTISKNTFCSAPPSRHCDEAGGDGGAYIVPGKGYSFTIKGLVYSAGCKRKSKPAVYTKVQKYINWILYKTKNAQYCKAPSYRRELAQLAASPE